jgi:hypothetical protein
MQFPAFLSSPLAQKLAILALYMIVGAGVQQGYLPPEVKEWLSAHTLEALALALGLGHVMPEAAKRDAGK